ncbi:MAG: ribonuclease HII [Bacteroidetes bacterium]|nr:MAG: ribonuclease HII [Bacteroidota bacterium]
MLKPFHQAGIVEAGCDEAGRGCLAGPVFAAAVILPPDFQHPLLNDSKVLAPARRQELRRIIESEALAWSVASLSPAEIDRLNILWASVEAMHRALDGLQRRPQSLLIDGNRFKPYRGLPHHCFVRGDGRYAAIAAASVLAKTHRDAFMEQLARQYPAYGWERNKGYPTAEHRRAILEHGPTPHHRRSFRLLPDAKQGLLF